jgi:hypothetical protein
MNLMKNKKNCLANLIFWTFVIFFNADISGAQKESKDQPKPLSAKTYKLPNLASDDIWITSVPLGLDFCMIKIPPGEASINIDFCKNPDSIKGKTPFLLKADPGHYLFRINRVYPILKKYESAMSNPFQKPSPWVVLGLEENEYPFFQDKDNLTKDGIIGKFKSISGASFKEGRLEGLGVDNIFKIEKKSGVPYQINALHFFTNTSFDNLEKLYPTGINFKFNTDEAKKKLTDFKAPSQNINRYIGFLQKGGKIAFFSQDGSTIVGEITYDNKINFYAIKNDKLVEAPRSALSSNVISSNILPSYGIELKGSNEVRIRDPNDFNVSVGLRQGNLGKDFTVPANSSSSEFGQNGKYDIYFVYSNKLDALFQGDSFTLNNNGVEIQIVKVVGGNYGIKQVK